MNENIITHPITSYELREQVLKNSKGIMEFFESDDLKVLLQSYSPVLYKRTFEKFRKLQTFEYNIAVAAGQSAGKSSVINAFVLEYPLLPFCDVATTCVPTVLRYGEKIKIEVTVQKVVTKNNVDKLKKVRSFSVPCSRNTLKEGLFNKLVDYFALCREVLALGNVSYFTKHPIKEFETVESKDLLLSENNPKHIAMLLLTGLCAYMKNNEDEDILSQTQIEARNTQQELLKEIGLNDNEKLYTVTVYWDAPLLKKGLVFYDLPGLGSDNISQNGYESHKKITEMALEEVQSMLYISKKEADGMGLDAIAQMLNSEAIRDLKSKQDRVIVALNKVDGLNPTKIKASVNDAKISLKKFNLEPKVYPISALTYGEKQYVDNGVVVNLLNTSTAEFYDLDFDDEVKRKIEKNNNKYPCTPFLKALNDYADKAVVTNTLEFVKSLYQLVEETSDELKSLIELYSSTSGNVSETNVIVKSALEKLLNQILTNFVTNANKRIEDAFNNFEDGRFQKANDELISGLEKEIKKLRDESEEFSKSKLGKNFHGDIVLYYRRKKKGKEYKEYKNPNYSNWLKMNNKIINFQFADSFSEYTKFLKNLVVEIRKTYGAIDNEVVKALREEFDNINKEIIEEIGSAKTKLRIEIENNSKRNEETEYLYNESVKFFEKIKNQFRNYVAECIRDIQANIGAQDTLDDLSIKLVNYVRKNQISLNQTFKIITKSFAGKLEHYGSWRTSTYCVNKADLLKSIQNDFVLTDDQKQMYIDTIRPELPVKGGCNEAVKHKKSAINAPLNSLSNKINYMITVLDPKNSSEIGAMEDLERKNLELLKKLKSTTNTSIGVEYAINQIKNSPEYKNELNNIEGVNFSLLLSTLQELIDKSQNEEG